ncbi:transposase family protein [Cupriavidus necator]
MPLPQRPVSQIFLDAFADLPDPRTRNCPYPLEELLFIALCGVTSGADSWVDVVLWAKAKRDWLGGFKCEVQHCVQWMGVEG